MKLKPVFIWEPRHIGNNVFEVFVCGKKAFQHSFGSSKSFGYAENKTLEVMAVQVYERLYGGISGSKGEGRN
jgi:hypothetical protein